MAMQLQASAPMGNSARRDGILRETLKAFCFRVLAPGAETPADRTASGWQGACVERANELTHALTERYTLFVGVRREGLLVANFLANRFGASLAELQSLDRGLIWMSKQVKESELNTYARVLIILPAEPNFTRRELACLEAAAFGPGAHATSVAGGAPILPIETVSTLAHGPRTGEDAEVSVSA